MVTEEVEVTLEVTNRIIIEAVARSEVASEGLIGRRSLRTRCDGQFAEVARQMRHVVWTQAVVALTTSLWQ